MKRYIAILTLALTAALSANQAFAIDPGNCSSALREADDLELLVAFVAYEYGTEAACEMLLELGYRPALAEDLVLEAIAIYGVRRYLAS